MFNLHLLSSSMLKDSIHYPVYMLVKNLYEKYNDYAKQQGFNLIYHENEDRGMLKDVDGIFSLWGHFLHKKPDNDKCKIAVFLDDVFWYTKEQLDNNVKLYRKYDLIFTTDGFWHTYKQY